jgi:hypothetical protein
MWLKKSLNLPLFLLLIELIASGKGVSNQIKNDQ